MRGTDQAFDEELQNSLQLGGLEGASVEIGPGVTVSQKHSKGGTWGPFGIVLLGTPNTFLAGELYLKHHDKWCKITAKNPSDEQLQVFEENSS